MSLSTISHRKRKQGSYDFAASAESIENDLGSFFETQVTLTSLFCMTALFCVSRSSIKK